MRQKEAAYGRRRSEKSSMAPCPFGRSWRFLWARWNLSCSNNLEPSRAICCQHPETTPGAIVRPSWRPPGPSWGSLGALLGPSWRPWRPSWGHLGGHRSKEGGVTDSDPPVGAFRIASWGPLGALLGALGPVLGPSWALLGPSWAILEPA